jgi:hypothetical protein
MEAFGLHLDRLVRGSPGKSLLLTGLRGVGKTVLLAELERISLERRWQYVHLEGGPDAPLKERLGPAASKALMSMCPPPRWKQATQLAARVATSFEVTFTPEGPKVGLRTPEEGKAQTGNLEMDLQDVFEALGAAAIENETGVVLAVDELHTVETEELAALIAATHRATQRKLPITIVGAGLPQLRPMAMAVKPYSERLFNFPELGALARFDSIRALVDPAAEFDLTFDQGALDLIVELTEGYPYFVQSYGFTIWNHIEGSRVAVADVRHAEALVNAELDENFFTARLSTSTALHRRCLLHLAQSGEGAVFDRGLLEGVDGVGAADVDQIVDELCILGLVFVMPNGLCSFSVPQFRAHLLRAAE